jgi:hypothetical protein
MALLPKTHSLDAGAASRYALLTVADIVTSRITLPGRERLRTCGGLSMDGIGLGQQSGTLVYGYLPSLLR